MRICIKKEGKKLSRFVLIDGNSIMNRAFYGIMGNKMLMTEDGTYTNAIYGFLAIMFKIMEDLQPEYMVVAFDLKAPTARHKMYEGYKATRKGMPDELAAQMPIIKEILKEMNIEIIEKEGYEADDVLGTLSCYGEKKKLEVTILSGDRDTFQLATNKVTIRIPRTKMGKTEVEDFDREKIEEIYGIKPKQLIEVKGLQGDTSDNIPGVPGIGEKTALSLIKKYKTIDLLYEKLERGETDLKGKLKENLENNKELAYLSKTLGTINLEVPIEETIDQFKVEEWNRKGVLEIFKRLKFNRYIERFHLEEEKEEKKLEDLFQIKECELEEIASEIIEDKKLIYYFEVEETKQEEIISKEIKTMYIYHRNIVYQVPIKEEVSTKLKEIWENENIGKYGYHLAEDYILLKQRGIHPANLVYDIEIAAYDLNPTANKYQLEDLAVQFLGLDINEYLEKVEQEEQTQINLFEETGLKENEGLKKRNALLVYCIAKLQEKMTEELEKAEEKQLFQQIEMPLVEVLAEMQWKGMYIDKLELEQFGEELTIQLDIITKEIYRLAGTEFNINSPKQLGEILFEKLQLPVYKKTKSGYSTDVDVLEKLRNQHPIVEHILEYRSLAKLNSTYVEGLKSYINKKTERIHSYFHQTITATGRISSTEPNLQNIPTRIELGKRLRKVFRPAEGFVYIDADYSQIELRVLAHISEDKTMINAFLHDEDIHRQAASQVLGIPIEEVTEEQRSHAKAVNFGIVYGISDFGLGEQIGVSRKKAKEYIEHYLEKYSGIKKFMDQIVEKAKEQGYVETLFNRRRYIPELKSNSYVVRQFGARAAMNTPIQGTAADIMKIAMIDVYQKLKQKKLKSKLVLQVHDELIIEAAEEEKEEVTQILQQAMESAIKLKVPLKVKVLEAKNWYEAK